MPVKLNKAVIKAAALANAGDDDLVQSEFHSSQINTSKKKVSQPPSIGKTDNRRDRLVRVAGMSHPPSDNQIDIFEFLDTQLDNYRQGNQTSSLAVEAVAGSGKTTTIVAASRLIPKNLNTMFLAFNKSIADELQQQLPPHVKAKTLNALGFGLLIPYLRGLGVSSPDVRGSRTFSIMSKELSFIERDDYGKDIKFLVNMCKAMGVVPVGVNDGHGIHGLEATDEVLRDICMHHSKMLDAATRNFVFQKVRDILAISFSDTNLYESSVIDFDDQKWLTVCKRPGGRTLAKPQYDVIIVDETQDVNSVDIELIKMVLKPNGIVIGVGDTRQAIYGFRGADAEAFSRFKMDFNAKTLPLDITYRCGSELVKHAQELVPQIKAAPNAFAGQVTRMRWNSKTFQPQDMVLCRNNAPLIEFAFKLIKDRVPVYVKGRNIGTGLIQLIDELVSEKVWVPNPNRPGKSMPKWTSENAIVPTLVRKLDQWRLIQIELIEQEDPDNEEAKQRVQDKYESIMVFIDDNKDGRVSSIIDVIDGMFSDENRKDAVICSTIHKSKGLEADRVYMYRGDLMYSDHINPGWQTVQEQNLDYVARTRGKELFAYLIGQ